MRALLVAVCFVVACRKPADMAIDQYINKDFAPAHAKILAARKAYSQVSAADIDEPGKVGHLQFRLGVVAAPFLAQALDESRKLTPPPAAKAFHDDTIEILTAEAPVIAQMAAALSPVDATAFKAAHAQMMDLQERVLRWEEFRTHLLAGAHVTLEALPQVRIPEVTQPTGSADAIH